MHQAMQQLQAQLNSIICITNLGATCLFTFIGLAYVRMPFEVVAFRSWLDGEGSKFLNLDKAASKN